MKLKKYRLMMNKTVKECADRLGVTEPCYRYWERGQKTPNPANMVDIFVWSKGHVAPNDFYDLPKLLNMAGPSSGATAVSKKVAASVQCYAVAGSSLYQSDLREPDHQRTRGSSVDVLPGQIDMFPSGSFNMGASS